MPLPSESNAWHEQGKAVNDAAYAAFVNTRHEAALHLQRKPTANDQTVNFIEDDFAQVLDVAISFDGTWHHRGFNSSHGVSIVMAVDTGEVLDFEVLSKDCSVCMKNDVQLMNRKVTCVRKIVMGQVQLRKLLQQKHCGQGQCKKDYGGTLQYFLMMTTRQFQP